MNLEDRFYSLVNALWLVCVKRLRLSASLSKLEYMGWVLGHVIGYTYDEQAAALEAGFSVVGVVNIDKQGEKVHSRPRDLKFNLACSRQKRLYDLNSARCCKQADISARARRDGILAS